MVMVHYFPRIEKLKIITYLRNAPKINLGFPESREKNSDLWIASSKYGEDVHRSSFIVRRSSFFVLPPCSSILERADNVL
jgi:hypothetical protein